MKKLPIKAAKDVAKAYGLVQVIIIARTRVVESKGVVDHVVTWGKTRVDCEAAARGGNTLKRFMGWPESDCRSRPRRLGGRG